MRRSQCNAGRFNTPVETQQHLRLLIFLEPDRLPADLNLALPRETIEPISTVSHVFSTSDDFMKQRKGEVPTEPSTVAFHKIVAFAVNEFRGQWQMKQCQMKRC